VVAAVGDGVTGPAAGDEVLGWTEERASQAELVAVPAAQVTAKPAALGRVGAGMRGSHQVGTAARLGEQAALVAAGDITVPIAATFPLDEVQVAYEQLAAAHPQGKLVFRISPEGAP
jgi:NADPH:quinone reductase-like Zn-dependent oxidoreductase